MPELSKSHFSAMHVYFALLAEELNNAGYDFKKFLEITEYRLDVPFNPDIVKNVIWRPYQQLVTQSEDHPHGIESTTKIDAVQAGKIFDVVNKRIGELTGVHVPFPCQEYRNEETKISNNG
jgi:hypothetical protein